MMSGMDTQIVMLDVEPFSGVSTHEQVAAELVQVVDAEINKLTGPASEAELAEITVLIARVLFRHVHHNETDSIDVWAEQKPDGYISFRVESVNPIVQAQLLALGVAR